MGQVDEVGFRPHPLPHHFSIHALIATHQTRDTTHPSVNGDLSSIPQPPSTMDRSQPSSSNLMGSYARPPQTRHRPPISIVVRPSSDTNAAQDNHNRLVADILTRYRTLMMLATVQAEGERSNATPETMAVSGISMKMEFDGLVRKSPPFLPASSTAHRLLELVHQRPVVAVAQDQGAVGVWAAGPGRSRPQGQGRPD